MLWLKLLDLPGQANSVSTQKKKTYPEMISVTTVLILRFENEFWGIIYSFFTGMQNIFFTVFNNKFVVKCPVKLL